MEKDLILSIPTMSLEKLLSNWRDDPVISSCFEEWKVLPTREGKFVPIPETIHFAIKDALQSMEINKLYCHQLDTWDLLQNDKNVVIVTGTASGKTLSYNLPVLDCLLREPDSRALYIFPTKALSQDQAQNLSNFIDTIEQSISKTRRTLEGEIKFIPPNHIRIGIYDGDTPNNERTTIRSSARIIISNPDMLHMGILPHHTSWANFFQHLRYIVIDEIHIYRGVFGSHVANVFRRLKRITQLYGSNPKFIMTSATIANPLELAETLIGDKVLLSSDDGSPKGKQFFLIYNPPIIDKALGIRHSALQETTRLASDLNTHGIQTIVFGRSRRTVELLLKYLRENNVENTLNNDDFSKNYQIRGYRSGYLATHRREIERLLRQGIARVVVTTNALELGIDIGEMGAVILVGYPGSIASTIQQAGRAGRKQSSSVAILVATADPLDQYLTHHPEYIFEKSPEHALINANNLLILLEHIRCASFELPFSKGDSFGNINPQQLDELLNLLCEEGLLYKSGQKFFWMSEKYPAKNVSLRNMTAENILLREENESDSHTIGYVDRYSAYWMVHPGAVYLHESKPYLVTDLDLETNIAHLISAEVDYYTVPQSQTTLELLNKLEEKHTPTSSGSYSINGYGEIMVTSQVIGYKKNKMLTNERLDNVELTLPPIELRTTGYWLVLPDDLVTQIRDQGLWQNDPNQYGPNWTQQKNRARERDRFCCQICGLPEKGTKHDIHHKIPYRWFTSYEEANQIDNLITLCPTCHQRAEMNVKIRSGLAGLSYILGHLAPFFLMCDTHDIGVHSDPKSPIFEGLPTVVIYDQYPDGIGFSQRLYELHPKLISSSLDTLLSCQCTDGCPSCVGPGGENGSGGKGETLAILKALV
jgi:DEAD/DEAH box helicase domain-containing protein